MRHVQLGNYIVTVWFSSRAVEGLVLAGLPWHLVDRRFRRSRRAAGVLHAPAFQLVGKGPSRCGGDRQHAERGVRAMLVQEALDGASRPFEDLPFHGSGAWLRWCGQQPLLAPTGCADARTLRMAQRFAARFGARGHHGPMGVRHRLASSSARDGPATPGASQACDFGSPPPSPALPTRYGRSAVCSRAGRRRSP